jgi:hypothetical protein
MLNQVAAQFTGGFQLLAFLVLFRLVATSPPRFLYDEPYFANYISLLHQHGFTTKFLISLNAAPGPLCAIVQVIFEPLTQLRPVAMRLGNVFLLIVVVLILVMWLKKQRDDYWVAGLSVLVVPMTWVVAGMALSEMSALMFVTLSLYLQLKGVEALEVGRPVLRLFVVGGVCLGIAVWGRQPYLLLSGVPVLLALLDRRLRMAAVVFVAVVLAVVAPLFAAWRGLLPPSQHSAQQGLSVTHGLISLAYTGICFLLLAPRFVRLPVKVLLGLVVLTVVANASFGTFALFPVRSVIDRYLPASAVPVYGKLCGSLLLACGIVFLALSLRMIWEKRMDLMRVTINVGLLCVAASPMFVAHQYSSRYTAMTLPYLILAAQEWRRWRLETVITTILGCAIGYLSLYGYFSH